MRLSPLVALAFFAFVSFATADELPLPGASVSVPPHDFGIGDVRPSQQPITGLLIRPPTGTGPFPVVILLHGCAGIHSDMQIWANRLGAWGYASLILDSFSPRGVYNVCAPADQPKVTRFDRAGDAMSAALFLRTMAGIDGNRVGVLGTSHGGGGAFTLTQRDFQNAAPGLIKASIDYYAACRNPKGHGTVPLLALAGEDDTWGNPAKTCTAFGQDLRADQAFEIKTYPGVVHAFENPNQRLTTNNGHLLNYNRSAAEDSYRRVHAFLDQYLGRAP